MLTIQDLVREARALTVEERKQLIALLVDTLTESEPAPARKKRSILEFEGVGAEMWQGVDVQDYLNELRDEWDERS